jgi:Aldehyde dehydrogenase family
MTSVPPIEAGDKKKSVLALREGAAPWPISTRSRACSRKARASSVRRMPWCPRRCWRSRCRFHQRPADDLPGRRPGGGRARPGDPAQIDAVLDRAVAVQRSWRQVPLHERAEVLGRLVTWMVDRADDIGRELSWQVGRPVTHSPLELTRGFAECATWLAGAAGGALADTEVEPREGCRRFIRQEPVGVVLVVAHPGTTRICARSNAVVPALRGGDAVVLRCPRRPPSGGPLERGPGGRGAPDGVFQRDAPRRRAHRAARTSTGGWRAVQGRADRQVGPELGPSTTRHPCAGI